MQGGRARSPVMAGSFYLARWSASWIQISSLFQRLFSWNVRDACLPTVWEKQLVTWGNLWNVSST